MAGDQNSHFELQLDDTLQGEGVLQRSDSCSSDVSFHSCKSHDSSNPEFPSTTSTHNQQEECLLTPSPPPTASLTEDDSNTSTVPIKPTGGIKTQPKKRISLNTTASTLNDARAIPTSNQYTVNTGNTKLPEYTAMRECYPHLINFVKETPSTITDALFAKGYISSAVRDSVRMESKSAADKARVLVDKVMDRITFNREIYHDFVEILKKEGICANDIIQHLWKTYRAKSKTYRAKSSCASASDPDSTTITGCADSSPPGGDSSVDMDEEGPQESAESSSTTTAKDAHHHGIQDGFICPSCKKCSVDEFFSKKGCPQAVSDNTEQQNMFPYLNTGALSELDRQELEAKLCKDADAIVLLFAEFELAIVNSFESRGLDVKLILYFILSLRNHSSLSPKVLVAKDEAKLNESTSILEIFSALHPYTSFFDYTLLQQIIEKFGTPDDQGRLETYVTAFGQFCKRNVFEIPHNMFRKQLRDENGKVFSFKYNTEQITTLGEVIKVRQSIADILNVSVWNLQLCSIDKGCVCLRFWIPLDVAGENLPVSKEKEASLLEIGNRVLDHGEADFRGRSPKTTSSPSQSSATPLTLEEPPSQSSPTSPVLVPSHGVVPSIVTPLPSKVPYTIQSKESGTTTLLAACDSSIDKWKSAFSHWGSESTADTSANLGGYGTCLGSTDNSTSRVFAMKRNNKSDQLMIDSIRSECHVLSGLGHHDHVIQFYGAVIDNEENNIYLPRVGKMFMELADSGNLAELLQLDDGTLSPLPIDQSLYYIEQLLQGVHFLHSNGVLHLDIKAVNVLVFDGGRTVKLADFGTAVKLSEIAAMRGQCVACTPYFAAPEVVLQEQPGFSADVWSVMCVLVELVTTRWPGCHTQRPGCPIQPISHPQMMYLIGKYDRDNDIEKLIPLSKLDLEPDVKELFHMVFVKDRTKRPSALDLLHHPKFMLASNYGRLFDEEYDEEMPEVVSADLSQQDVPMNMEAQAPPTQLRYCGSMNSDLETDHVNGGCDARKRESQDSGTGDEFPNSFDVRGHSGFDTPSSIDKWRSAFSHWGSESTEDTSANLVTKQFENSSSFGGYTSQNSATRTQTQNTHFSHSNLETQTPNAQFTHLSTSNYRLHHSHSAPIISNSFDRRRRSSLQTYHTHSSSCEGSETAGGRPKLRRTSSMVYVDKGPDIDVPDITNVPSIQDLITSVSVLNLDHTHSSSSWQSNGYQGADEGRPHSHQSVPQLTSTYHSVSPNSQLGQTGLTDLSKTRQTGLSCLDRDGQTGLTGYSTGGNDQGISENTPINTQLAKSEQTSLTGYSRVGNGVISVATPITGKPVQKTVTVYETIC